MIACGWQLKETYPIIGCESAENRIGDMLAIKKNPFVTASELSEILGISLRKTKENMRKLHEAGLIRRIGPDKGGHWEVVEE